MYILNPNFSIVNLNGILFFTSLENNPKVLKVENLNNTWIDIFSQEKIPDKYSHINNNVLKFLIDNKLFIKPYVYNNWLHNSIDYADYTEEEKTLKYDKEKMLAISEIETPPSIIKNIENSDIVYDLSKYNYTNNTKLAEIFSGDFNIKKWKLGLEMIANILFYGCAAQKEGDFHESQKVLLKTYPSNGSRHVLDFYIAVKNKEWIENGVYYYDPIKYELKKICDLNENICDSLSIIVTCEFERMQWRYRNSWIYRDILFEYGHFHQNFKFLLKGYGLKYSEQSQNFCYMEYLSLGETEEILSEIHIVN